MSGHEQPPLALLDPDLPGFPPTDQALRDPDGLLAVGGDLTPEWLVEAYSSGIFPWYSEDQPILWWSPDPRCVVLPGQYSIGRSLRKALRRQQYRITFDQDFASVIDACRSPRGDEAGTWITEEMRDAYLELHRRGLAHSVEAWCDGDLVGGLYGVALGKVFFGESMFHRATDASKVAFVHLVQQLHLWGCELIDCQVSNPHLLSLGAVTLPRWDFEARLRVGVADDPFVQPWVLEWKYE